MSLESSIDQGTSIKEIKPTIFSKIKTWYRSLRCVQANFIISHQSKFKDDWDFLVMIAACWNVFLMPIEIAFTFHSVTVDVINLCVDFIFIIDMIIVFRTTIMDEYGNEISDYKIIGKKYLRGSFVVDLLSSIPFDSIAAIFIEESEAEKFALLGILKMIRVLRLNRIILYLNVKRNIKDSIRFVKMIFFLLMYLHFIGCIWYFLINLDKLWISPSEY